MGNQSWQVEVAYSLRHYLPLLGRTKGREHQIDKCITAIYIKTWRELVAMRHHRQLNFNANQSFFIPFGPS
ncbi:hypothetical protein [Duganella sp. HH105]|uniref:hypothetical protein n=1 Tax=Duganella sp. HH105 TaxID=1781067 RepID=UPI0014388F45|nr:hypothetical protein [Duganella sp. HH105]